MSAVGMALMRGAVGAVLGSGLTTLGMTIGRWSFCWDADGFISCTDRRRCRAQRECGRLLREGRHTCRCIHKSRTSEGERVNMTPVSIVITA